MMSGYFIKIIFIYKKKSGIIKVLNIIIIIMIKNIIFDFGDIFINLDKEATYREMAKLGVSKITPQMIQVYQEYEKGLMETSDFINYFSSSFPILNKDLIFVFKIKIFNS